MAFVAKQTSCGQGSVAAEHRFNSMGDDDDPRRDFNGYGHRENFSDHENACCIYLTNGRTMAARISGPLMAENFARHTCCTPEGKARIHFTVCSITCPPQVPREDQAKHSTAVRQRITEST